MIGKPNTLRPSLKMTVPQPLLTASKPLDTASSAESLWYFGEEQNRLPLQNQRPYLFNNLSQLSMSTSEVKSWCFINLLKFLQFAVKYLLNLGSRPLTFVMNSCLRFQRLLLKMYVEYIHNQKMSKFNTSISSLCFLFLIKLRWPKNKSI